MTNTENMTTSFPADDKFDLSSNKSGCSRDGCSDNKQNCSCKDNRPCCPNKECCETRHSCKEEKECCHKHDRCDLKPCKCECRCENKNHNCRGNCRCENRCDNCCRCDKKCDCRNECKCECKCECRCECRCERKCECKGNFCLCKVDHCGRLLGGAKFIVCDECGKEVCKFETCRCECFKSPCLPCGRYKLIEVEAPCGFRRNECPICFEIRCNRTTNLRICNRPC